MPYGVDLEYRGVLFPGIPGDAHVVEVRAYGVAANAPGTVNLDFMEFAGIAAANRFFWNPRYIPQGWLKRGELLEAALLALNVGASFAPAAASSTKWLTFQLERVKVQVGGGVNDGQFISSIDTKMAGQVLNPLKPSLLDNYQVEPNCGGVVLPRYAPLWNLQNLKVGADEGLRLTVTTNIGGGVANAAPLQAVGLVACYARPDTVSNGGES